MKTLPIVVASMAVLVAACGTVPAAPTVHPLRPSTASSAPASPLPTGVSTGPVPAPGSCHARSVNGQPLPDPVCTPGAINPNVTDDNNPVTGKQVTICKSNWTDTIRPPVSYTNTLKRQQIAAYGFTDTRMGDYEQDHFIPLSLGGAPRDPRNLWPELGASPNVKDKVEDQLHRAVCSGRIALAEAQRRIATDWTTATNGL